MNQLLKTLKSLQPVYIDTSCFIYTLENHPKFHDLAKPIFTAITDQQIIAITSIITLTEVLTKPYKLNRTDLIKAYLQIFFRTNNLSLVTPDTQSAITAAQLRALYNLHLPDAYQITLALESNCRSFLTNDQKLKQIKGIKVFCLSDFT